MPASDDPLAGSVIGCAFVRMNSVDDVDVVSVFDGGAPVLDCLHQLCRTRPLWEEAVLGAGEQTVLAEMLEESISDN